MGSRFLLLLAAAGAVGLILFVAMSGDGPVDVNEGPRGPDAPREESFTIPPAMPDDPGTHAKEAVPGKTSTLVARVVTGEGKPAAGAIVTVLDRTVTAGSDGTARIENLPVDTPLLVRVRGADPADIGKPRGVRLAEDEETTVVLTLVRGGSIEGTILGSGGAPFGPAFSLDLEKAAKPTSSSMRFGRRRDFASALRNDFPAGNGAFTFPGLEAGWYLLRAKADGHVPATSRPFEVKPGEATTGIEITLERGGSIAGVVTDATTGKPVPGVGVSSTDGDRMWISTAGPFGEINSGGIMTDDQGRFRLTGIAPGSYRVAGRKKGYATGKSKEIVVEAGAEIRGVLIALGRGGTITGTVYGADGKPLVGEAVLIQSVRGGLQIFGDMGIRVKTDGKGVYVKENLDPGRYRVKRPSSKGGMGMVAIAMTDFGPDGKKKERPLADDMVEVREGEVAKKDLFAAKRANLRGVVVDEAGKPVATRQVEIRKRKEKKPPKPGEITIGIGGGAGGMILIPQFRTTNKKGEFRFEGIEPGRWEVTCCGEVETVTIGAGETGEVRLTIAPARVEGIVTDDGGRPVQGLRVRLDRSVKRGSGFSITSFNDKAVKTDDRGQFVFTEVAPGRYTVRATGDAAEGESEPFEVGRGATVKGVRISVVPLVEVVVKFVDAGGKPIDGHRVHLDRVGEPTVVVRRATSASGEVTFHVRPGEYVVRSVKDPGMTFGSLVERGRITVRAGSPVRREIRIE